MHSAQLIISIFYSWDLNCELLVGAGFELIAIWMDKVVESSVEMAEFENVSTYEADKWFLVPITLPDP